MLRAYLLYQRATVGRGVGRGRHERSANRNVIAMYQFESARRVFVWPIPVFQ